MQPDQAAQCILYIIVILLLAKVMGELAERVHQPAVVGELIAGIILGGSVLGFIRMEGPAILSPACTSLAFLAELGVILLLFEVGLDSDLDDFLRVGPSALMVAVVGVIGPFALGYLVSILFHLPGTVAIFMGAALTATSVGITARTLGDLGQIRTNAARTILGAAVIDDVLGLIILAVVGGLSVTGHVSYWQIGKTTILAIAFLVGSIAIGIPLAPHIMRVMNRLRTRGMLTISAFLFCLVFAFIAHELGLAAIVGAFAAGLVLAKTCDQVRIQERIKPIADIFIPIFFVILGVSVNLSVFNPSNVATRGSLALASALILVAIAMKIIAGLGVLRKGINRLVVGVGMIPRGEVGLIFASIGLSKQIINSAEYSAIVAVVVFTTLITPPLLKQVLKNQHEAHRDHPKLDAS